MWEPVNSSHGKWCDELTILFDPAFVAFKSFAVVGDFDITHAVITCHVVHVCATSRFFHVSRAQITVVSNHLAVYDTVTLETQITKPNGFAVALLCDELTGSVRCKALALCHVPVFTSMPLVSHGVGKMYRQSVNKH